MSMIGTRNHLIRTSLILRSGGLFLTPTRSITCSIMRSLVIVAFEGTMTEPSSLSSSERKGKRAEREERRGKRAERDERRETGGERREKREERREKREERRDHKKGRQRSPNEAF